MNDRIFDLLYKAEQREIVAKLRQKEELRRNLPVANHEPMSLQQGLQRTRQVLKSISERLFIILPVLIIGVLFAGIWGVGRDNSRRKNADDSRNIQYEWDWTC